MERVLLHSEFIQAAFIRFLPVWGSLTESQSGPHRCTGEEVRYDGVSALGLGWGAAGTPERGTGT